MFKMAFKHKIIHNPKTGQDIQFIQTRKDTEGKLLEMESTYNEYSKEPVAHYHPHQVEDFTVLTGELTIRMNGELTVLKEGDSIHIPANTVHSMWNNSQNKTMVNWKIQPAMDTEYFLETAIGLVNHSKTNKDGMPNLLQVALMANKYSGVFRLSKPPFPIQKTLFIFLTPFAYLLGYKPSYKQYLD